MKRESGNKDIVRTVLDISLFALMILSIASIAVAVYFYFLSPHDKTGVNYIGDQVAVDAIVDATDLEQTELDFLSERAFFEVNVYKNENKQSIALAELKINYFSDKSLTLHSQRSSGMQFFASGKNAKDLINVISSTDRVVNLAGPLGRSDQKIDPRFYYYDILRDDTSYSGQTGQGLEAYYDNDVHTPLNRAQTFVVKIDNEPYQIQLNGQFKSKILWISVTHDYTWTDLFLSFLQASLTATNAEGTLQSGEFFLSGANISSFFTVKKWDEKSGQFKGDVALSSINSYASVKLNVFEGGAVKAQQSLFSNIGLDKEFNFYGVEDADYWKEEFIFDLTEQNLNSRYSESQEGYFLSLSVEQKMELMKENIKINLIIDLDKTIDGKQIIGLDYLAFENVKIESFLVKSSGNKAFVLSAEALKNTGIKVSEITVKNVVLINSTGGDES